MTTPGKLAEKPSSVAGTAETDKTPAIVLDTNVVLDWQLFRDGDMAALGAALEAGELRWIATPAMLDELAAVLARPGLEGRAGKPEHVLTFARSNAELTDAPVPPPGNHPICRDPDDQKFIDLALATGARWLVTRDKALLALAKAAARGGVTVCTPAAWSPDG